MSEAFLVTRSHLTCQYSCSFPRRGRAGEAWKISVLVIVILWSSWPADTVVRFQCGIAGDKWGFKRSLKSKSLPMPTARLCPPHYDKQCVAFFIHAYVCYNITQNCHSHGTGTLMKIIIRKEKKNGKKNQFRRPPRVKYRFIVPLWVAIKIQKRLSLKQCWDNLWGRHSSSVFHSTQAFGTLCKSPALTLISTIVFFPPFRHKVLWVTKSVRKVFELGDITKWAWKMTLWTVVNNSQ